jgi:hypothetical protein
MKSGPAHRMRDSIRASVRTVKRSREAVSTWERIRTSASGREEWKKDILKQFHPQTKKKNNKTMRTIKSDK